MARMTLRRVAPLLLLYVSIATPALADPQEKAPPSTETPKHDGFYLRLGVGGGGLDDTFRGDALGIINGTATGASASFELGLGYAVRPGLIIGGGIFVESVQSPKIEVLGVQQSTDIHVGILGLVGPMIDWYPSKEYNWHLEGALCGARITLADSTGTIKDQQPIGGGLVAGIGYEWWLDDGWGLGVSARVIGATLDDGTFLHNVGVGSVLLTTTFN